ncbi:PASTA domain-containing protein [Microbacterium sp. NPDC089189]|uniref:protein kinase domain-containing protein n=1 Tax=Microbacterium sp. NPDC089189 TaxID=3154972 RepID=UPI00341E7E74
MTDGLVAGRFRIRALLGSGGTAAVFAADDEWTDRRVALKLLHPHLAEERPRWDAFFEEVAAARSIVHPNLAEVYDAGVDESDTPVVWIAMELIDGVPLIDRVREQGPLEPEAARALIRRVLDALAAVHAGGVVHRDVTPANIMLPSDDADPTMAGVRLLDFGLADIPGRAAVGADALLSASAGENAQPGVVASVAYASPEHLRGEPVTEAGDLYQVGAVLYFALTGAAPYGGDAAKIARAHLTSPPPLPSARRRGVPRDLDRVVTTALMKDPSDRFASAGAMRDALAVSPPTVPVPAAAPTEHVVERAAEDDEAAPTRVYRTSVGASGPAPVVAGAALLADPPRARWPAWTAAAVGAAAIVAVVALSAAAGSAPTTAPTPPPSLPAATPAETPVDTPAAPPEVETVGVPDVAGRGLGDATAVLEAAGLRIGQVTRVDGPAAGDTVLSVDPGAGSLRERGSAVDLTVASGSNTVPAVIGMAASDAAAALSAAGFSARIDETGTAPVGAVASSIPVAGTVLPVGSTVTIVVPRPPDPVPTLPAPPTPTLTPTPQPSPTEAG